VRGWLRQQAPFFWIGQIIFAIVSAALLARANWFGHDIVVAVLVALALTAVSIGLKYLVHLSRDA
jgi:hypothetical protein